MSVLSGSSAAKMKSLTESRKQDTRIDNAEPQHDLSADELRSKLFHSLHSKGLVNTVKSQLRNKLALELHELAATKMKKGKRKKVQDGSLLQQLSNEVVADYLQCCHFDYTLSVFGPESMTNIDKITRYEDILTFLGIQSDHAVHQTLIKECRSKHSKGFLWALLTATATLLKREQSDVSCQADDLSVNARDQLEKRMRDVDQTFDTRKKAEDSANDRSSLEARLIAFQRQAEASKREELNAEIEKFRAGEARRLELFHKEECRRQLEATKRELEDEYSRRFEALSKRERETMDRLHAQEKMLEEEAYKQRQNLLQEMQKHQEREMTTKHSHQLAMKSVELEEQRLGALAEQLRLKEETLRQMDERCESRVRDEVLRAKLQLQEDQRKREEVFHLQEQQLREDKASFESQKEAYMRLVDEAETKREKIPQLEASLQAAKNVLASVTHKYDVAMERIREMADYQRIKERLLVTEKELEQTRKKVAEIISERNTKEKEFQNLLKEVMDTKSKPSENQEKMYNKILKEKESFMTKEMEYQQKLSKTEDKYQEEIRRNKALMRQHEEQMMRQRAMLNEIADLKLAFQKQRQSVEASKLSPRMTNREQPSLFRAAGAVDLSPERVRTHRSPRRKLWVDDDPFEYSAQNNLRQQKEVFSKLEKEANELEKAYQDFQERQTHITKMAQSPVLRPLQSLGSSPLRENQDYIFSVTRLSGDIPEKDTDADFASIPTRMSHPSPKRPMSTSASVPLTSSLSHPLSSTQAPGASKPVSLGLSTMMLPNDVENERTKFATSSSSGQLVLTDLDNRSHRYGSSETLLPQTLSKVPEHIEDQGKIGPPGFEVKQLADSGVKPFSRQVDYKDEKTVGFPPSVKLKTSDTRISQREPSVSHINHSSPTHTIPTCYSLTQEPIQNLSTTTTNQSASAAPQSYWQQQGRNDFGPRSPREFEHLTPLAERSGEGDLGVNGPHSSFSGTRNAGNEWSRTAFEVKNSDTEVSLRETALIVLDSSTKDGNITYRPTALETELSQPLKDGSASFGRGDLKSDELEPRSMTPTDTTRDYIEQPVLSLDQAWKTQQKPSVPIIPLPDEPHYENEREKERRILSDAGNNAQQSEVLTKSSPVVSPAASQSNSGQEDPDGSGGKNGGGVDLMADVNPLMKQYMEMVLKQREGGTKEIETKKTEGGISEKSASEQSAESIKSKVSHSYHEPRSTHEATDDEFDWG